MSQERESSGELIKRWRSGDIEAGNQLYERFVLGLYLLIHGRLSRAKHSEGDTSDAVQNVWLKFLFAVQKSLYRHINTQALRGYLGRIARNTICSRDPRTEKVTALTEGLGYQKSYSSPVPSPDGRQIALLNCCDLDQKDQGIHGISLMRTDGSGLRAVIDSSGGSIGAAQWLPDGKGFVAPVRTGNRQHLWKISLDGRERRQLTGLGKEGDDYDDLDPDACPALPLRVTE